MHQHLLCAALLLTKKVLQWLSPRINVTLTSLAENRCETDNETGHRNTCSGPQESKLFVPGVCASDPGTIRIVCCPCIDFLPLYLLPRLAGGSIILSTVPTVDWVLLGSSESKKGLDFGSLYCSLLQTHLASRQEKRVLIIIIDLLPQKFSEVLATETLHFTVMPLHLQHFVPTYRSG